MTMNRNQLDRTSPNAHAYTWTHNPNPLKHIKSIQRILCLWETMWEGWEARLTGSEAQFQVPMRPHSGLVRRSRVLSAHLAVILGLSLGLSL